jgi:hypothetical protein
MAKPAKRRVEGTRASSGTAATTSSESDRSSTTSKRVTPKGEGQRTSSRYTPPRTGAVKGPSPRWVPVLMFALWGLGLLVIVLNYMGVLPGSSDGGNGWYLVAGLVSILGGILVATQYR